VTSASADSGTCKCSAKAAGYQPWSANPVLGSHAPGSTATQAPSRGEKSIAGALLKAGAPPQQLQLTEGKPGRLAGHPARLHPPKLGEGILHIFVWYSLGQIA
jgi:hypothetical protein